MTNLIEAAVTPLKTEAVQRAEQEARKIIDRVRADLEAHGWDRNACAAYPRSDIRREDYVRLVGKYKLYATLTREIDRHAAHTRTKPVIVAMHQDGIDKFITDAKTDAGEQYDAFVAKLVRKVGDVTAATLAGNHVWGYSHLSVAKADGTREVWKTQMIVNVSKLGKLFNQWPTRKQR